MSLKTMSSTLRHRLSTVWHWLAGLVSPKPPPGAAEAEAEQRPLALERAVGYSFARRELLKLALTHPRAGEGSDHRYARLEFLGRAVGDLAIAHMPMLHFPDGKEGLLSRQRASI